MAGRPETKKRREREAAAASRHPVKPEVKREALQLAEEVGPAEAARRTGQKASTIRMWKTRAAKAAKPRAATSQAGGSAGESMSDTAPPASRAQIYRDRADLARERQYRAEDRADKLNTKSQAAEGRNASTTADRFHDRAGELDESARLEELHEVALSQAQGRLVLDFLGSVFDDLALPRPDGLLRARLQGWPEEPDAEVVEQAREEVRRAIRAEVRAEMLAEAEEARRARPALPAGEAEEEPQGEEVVDADVVGEAEPESEQPEGEPEVKWTEPEELPDGSVAMSYPRDTTVVTESWEGPARRRRGRHDFSHPGLG